MTNELLAEVSILREKVEKYEKALEDIRAEIANLTITQGGEDYVRKMAELYSLKIMVLKIIDKHIGEIK